MNPEPSDINNVNSFMEIRIYEIKKYFPYIFVLSTLILINQSYSQTGFLKITSEPSGVKIQIDKRVIGTTNPKIVEELTAGSYTLIATKSGYSEFKKSFRIEADNILKIKINLTRSNEKIEKLNDTEYYEMKPQVGTLIITSMPPELLVYINGEKKGETPLKISNHPIGKLKVKVGNNEKEIYLAENSTLRIKVKNGKFVAQNKPSGEYYKVIRVKSNDFLNLREKPSHKSAKVGTIPFNGKCIHYLGKSVFVGKHYWLFIEFRRQKGWVNSYYLKEDKCD